MDHEIFCSQAAPYKPDADSDQVPYHSEVLLLMIPIFDGTMAVDDDSSEILKNRKENV